jgi:hypothetical protein
MVNSLPGWRVMKSKFRYRHATAIISVCVICFLTNSIHCMYHSIADTGYSQHSRNAVRATLNGISSIVWALSTIPAPGRSSIPIGTEITQVAFVMGMR